MPIAATHMPVATATAEPLLEPPGVHSRFQGLRVGGGSKQANSVVTVLPRMMAPASPQPGHDRRVGRGRQIAGQRRPGAVGNPSTSMMSLMPIAIPAKRANRTPIANGRLELSRLPPRPFSIDDDPGLQAAVESFDRAQTLSTNCSDVVRPCSKACRIAEIEWRSIHLWYHSHERGESQC